MTHLDHTRELQYFMLRKTHKYTNENITTAVHSKHIMFLKQVFLLLLLFSINISIVKGTQAVILIKKNVSQYKT